jgi:fungalysin metallopeptidase (M36)/HYR domain-containing protein
MALFEVRARIIHRLGHAVGNQRALQVVTDAMKLDPVNPTPVSARNSLLTADAAGFSGADEVDIWAGFAARGIGFGSSIQSLVNFNVIESFDKPIPGMGAVTFTEASGNMNGFADPGENLTLSIPLTNPLTQTLTGVTATVVGGGTASYGTLASGQTTSQNISYTLPANTVPGDKVTLSVVVTSNLGTETKTFKLRTGTPVQIFAENFDGVTAPALPAGWTTSQTGSETLWVTSTTASDSGPNAASTGFPSTTGANDLVSPSFVSPSTDAQVTFRHSYNSEIPWDGGVLEFSVNGGAFTDVLDSGGSFETGGYAIALNRTADGNTNALQARAAWTGNSGGFVTTTANIPAAAGDNIRLRFRAGSDSSTTVTNNHWRIDTIVVTAFPCAIAAMANITHATDLGQCGALVSYAGPTTSGQCGTTTCAPASGAFFPKGTTTVTCTSQSTQTSSFTVTVNDTQAPGVTCPANVTVIAAAACPSASMSLFTYATPAATDNCPGATTSCVPPSGSGFPIGTTTVSCTATDTSGNSTVCSFSVTVFDVSVQDDSNPSSILLWNSLTGDFRYCCSGQTFSGRGTIQQRGCVVTLDFNGLDRRITGRVDKVTFRGTASVQSPIGTTLCSISDRDVRGNTATCQ